MRLAIVLLLISVLVLSGCSDGKLNAGVSAGTSVGSLYVSTPSAVLRFNSALTVTGNVAPSITISGAATTLSAPSRMVLDVTADRLFIANPGSSSILIYESASKVTGNAAPTRTLAGVSTLLAAPSDLALDTVNNALYVADGSRILVFLSASTTTGNVPPVHNIIFGSSVGGVLLDTVGNRLYVADTLDNAIDRLEGATTQDGPAVIAGTISGVATLLAHPGGLALDAAGRLFVANAATPSITVYANASILTGNIAPTTTISGALTLLGSPGQLFLNSTSTTEELYVADSLAGSVLIFSNVATITGNIAPTRSLSGSTTGLAPNAVNGLVLDPTR